MPPLWPQSPVPERRSFLPGLDSSQENLYLPRIAARRATREGMIAEDSAKMAHRLELALRAGGLGTWELDLSNWKMQASGQCKTNFGRNPDDDFSYEEFKASIHAEDRDAVTAAANRAIEGHDNYGVEYRSVWPDGSAHWIRANGLVVRNAEGQAVALFGVTQDITQQKQAAERERQLMAKTIEATAKFRAVFDQSAVFAGIMTTDGIVIEANRMCLEACGYSAEEVLGRLFWETAWWRKNKDVQEKIRNATEQVSVGNGFQAVLPYHWADGSEHIVDFSLHPILDANGKVIFLHSTGTDITERRRDEDRFRNLTESLESEVGLRTKELEDRNSDVVRQSELLRTLSQRLMEIQDEERRRIARELHDSAGQLLAGLSMSVGMIAREAESVSPQIAKEAEESRKLIQEIIEDIRTMSYLLHPPLLDESGLWAALRWYVRGLKSRGSLDISMDFPEEFARLPRELELVVFRLVQECLTNIYRHSGSKTAAICISRERGNVVLEVQDAGKGISAEMLSEIEAKGAGVGIQGMRERIRQFGGKMNIESGNFGTRVVVTLPIPKG